MELDFLSAHMRNPPIFRGIFSSFYPVPRTRLILCSNEPQLGNFSLFPSLHFNRFSCAVVQVVESNCPEKNPKFQDSVGYGAVQVVEPNCPSVEKHPNFQDSVGRRRLSTKELKYGAKKRLVDRGDGGFLMKDKKRGIKWYSEMLKDYAAKLCLKEGKALHGEMIRCGVEPDSHLWFSLIIFYSKCGDLVFAGNAFDLIPSRDVVSRTSLIAGFIVQGYGSKGICLFRDMRGEGIRPNEFTLAIVLKDFSICSDLEFGKQLHAEVVKGAAFSNVYIGFALVNLYAKCCELESAGKVFFFMPEQNSVSWNVLLNALREEHLYDSLAYYELLCDFEKCMLVFVYM